METGVWRAGVWRLRTPVIVDAVDEESATCRNKADAPEIDDNRFIDEGFEELDPRDIVKVDAAGEYDQGGTISIN